MTFPMWTYVAVASLGAVAVALAEKYREQLSTSHQDAASSVIGLVLGMVGFFIAIGQILAVKSNSKAAQDAVERLSFRIAVFEDLTVCENVLKTVAEIERMHVSATVSGDFASHVYLPERYRTLRAQLLELRSRIVLRLSKDQKVMIQTAITRLVTYEKLVTQGLRSASFPKLQTLDIALAHIADDLVGVTIELQKEALGTNVS